MVKRLFLIVVGVTLYLNSNGLMIDTQSMGRGAVDMAIGGSSHSVLLNPANLNVMEKNSELRIEFSNELALNENTLSFLKTLSRSSEDGQEISQLMKKNIGNLLYFHANSFLSISQKNSDYSWLLGFYNDIEGHFITHTGFGSIGAMESFIERYRVVVGTLSWQDEHMGYGLNLKAIEKYQTIHNYTISEMIEKSGLMDYLDNGYTKKEEALAIDAGINYTFSKSALDAKLALSVLNIGDTSFKSLGSTPSSTNMGLSFKPKWIENQELLVGLDYMNIFKERDIRFGVSGYFLDKDLTLSSGLFDEHLTFGLAYQYFLFTIALSTYKKEDRSYQLSVSLLW